MGDVGIAAAADDALIGQSGPTFVGRPAIEKISDAASHQ
jgi:hypothetical protein